MCSVQLNYASLDMKTRKIPVFSTGRLTLARRGQR